MFYHKIHIEHILLNNNKIHKQIRKLFIVENILAIRTQL